MSIKFLVKIFPLDLYLVIVVNIIQDVAYMDLEGDSLSLDFRHSIFI